MGFIGWLAIGVYIVANIGALIANTRPHAQERAVLRFAENVGLPLPNHLSEPIRQRMLHRRRITLIGGLFGVTLTALVLLPVPFSTPWSLFDPLIIVAGAFAGQAVGASVSAIRTTALRDGTGRPRYARAQAVELNDYVSRTERWLARTPVALALVSLIMVTVFVQLGLARYGETPVIVSMSVLTAVAVGSLIVFEVVGRKVVAKGNHVESGEELVWEDAVRATTVRELAGAPAFLGYYSLLMSVSPVVASPEPGAVGVAIMSLGIAVLTLVVALAMLVSVLAVKRHFLRRLWPELAAVADNPRPVEATP